MARWAGTRCMAPMLTLSIRFLIATIAAAINQRMARQLEYAQEEVRTLKEALAAVNGSGRIRFTEAQRRRLALMGKALKQTVKVVPWPGSLSTSMQPPNWRTIAKTVERPRPVPLSTSLVVKNGSKMRPASRRSSPRPCPGRRAGRGGPG